MKEGESGAMTTEEQGFGRKENNGTFTESHPAKQEK